MTQEVSDPDLYRLAHNVRRWVIQMSHTGKTAHLASSLSCADLLVAVFWGGLDLKPETFGNLDRDHFILSKGHAATTLYAVLAAKGYFPEENLEKYADAGGNLPEHPTRQGGLPGVELASGSLGHGLSMGVGMALGAKLKNQENRVCVVMSDGECNEGSIWEAAMFAPVQKLDNLCVIVDYNKWQATGRSNETMALSPLREKFAAFGWRSLEIDGHDPYAVRDAMAGISDGSGKPLAIVAHTVKGKGVSFMEDDNNWHYRSPTAEEVQLAWAELDTALESRT